MEPAVVGYAFMSTIALSLVALASCGLGVRDAFLTIGGATLAAFLLFIATGLIVTNSWEDALAPFLG